MQFNSLILTLSLFTSASLVQAQNLTGLPDCAVTCFDDNFINSACDRTNATCLCGDSTFFGDVETCVLGSCSSDDTLTTLSWAEADCAAAGVPLTKREFVKVVVRSLFGRKH